MWSGVEVYEEELEVARKAEQSYISGSSKFEDSKTKM